MSNKLLTQTNTEITRWDERGTSLPETTFSSVRLNLTDSGRTTGIA